jgi:hypothetical protein
LRGGFDQVLLPEVMSFPEALAERLAFAIQTSSIHFLLVLVAVRLCFERTLSFGGRYWRGRQERAQPGARDQGRIPAKYARAVILGRRCPFAPWFDRGGPMAGTVDCLACAFAIGRVSFYRCYSRGAGARAFGMATTALAAHLLFGRRCVDRRSAIWRVMLAMRPPPNCDR